MYSSTIPLYYSTVPNTRNAFLQEKVSNWKYTSPATSYPSPSASSSILLTNLHWNTQLSRRLWDVSVFSLLWSKLLIISIRCYTREEVSWRMRSELMQFSFLSTIIWQIWYSVVNQHIFLWVFLYFFTFPFFNIQFQ